MTRQLKIRRTAIRAVRVAFEEMLKTDNVESWWAIHQDLKRVREIVLRAGLS